MPLFEIPTHSPSNLNMDNKLNVNPPSGEEGTSKSHFQNPTITINPRHNEEVNFHKELKPPNQSHNIGDKASGDNLDQHDKDS